jgi:hypothetical protein
VRKNIRRLLKGFEPLREMHRRYADRRLDKQTIAFIRRLFEAGTPAASGDEVGFVIEPWPAFPSIPSYVIAFALAFVSRGKRVCLIWDDLPFGTDPRSEMLLQRRIGHLLAHFPSQIRTVRLSECAMAGDCILPEKDFQTLAKTNSIRQYLSETPPDHGAAFEASALAALRDSAVRAEAALRSSRFDYLVVPGGVYRTSGVFVQLGRALGVRVATFDCGRDTLMISTDGIAAYLDDMPRAFEAVANHRESAIQEAKAEFAKRCEGRDAFSSQAIPAQDAIPSSTILMPLNQSFDTPALGRHRMFENQTEWMLETVGWILANTAETVTVRRHPVERHEEERSRDDYRALLRSRFGDNDRILYVAPEAPVSTYDILRGARLVLPHVSTVGVEAAAMGVPVVTHSDSYYDSLGFVWSSSTREEYFENIRRALAGELIVSDDQRSKAWLTYYLGQCCNFFWTRFTPERIREILRACPNETLAKDIDIVFTSIDTNTPLSLFLYEANLRDRP